MPIPSDQDMRRIAREVIKSERAPRNARPRWARHRGVGGIDQTRIGKADGAISARSGTTVGSGTVSVYTLVGTTLTDTGVNETWYNLADAAVTSGAYVQGKVVGSVVFVDFEDC